MIDVRLGSLDSVLAILGVVRENFGAVVKRGGAISLGAVVSLRALASFGAAVSLGMVGSLIVVPNFGIVDGFGMVVNFVAAGSLDVVASFGVFACSLGIHPNFMVDGSLGAVGILWPGTKSFGAGGCTGAGSSLGSGGGGGGDGGDTSGLGALAQSSSTGDSRSIPRGSSLRNCSIS